MQNRCHKVVLVFLLVISPFFFWGGPGEHSARTVQELWNIGHIIFFFLLTLYLFFRSTDTQASMFGRFLSCVFVTVILGGVIELLQLQMPGRSFSVADLARDLSGCMIALSVVIIKERNSIIVRLAGIASGSAILAVSSFSLITAVQDEVAAWKDFPLLAGFERAFELPRWETNNAEVSLVADRARSGRHALRLGYSTAKYSGLSLVYFPRDWRGYGWLAFSVYNPGEPITLHFRVHDRLHRERQEYDNRYNGSVLLRVGWNDIRICMQDIVTGPRGRVMDLEHIQGFGIFVVQQEEKGVLYLDDVRVE